ncbi:hypothetical protein F8144_01365 [Streptomyces triticiradicis]|uniref:IS110 family transposase n=1 Tax=Streptomyces triticiradicis TaxID=2651189 RepID=A0A7J5DPL4_9ACTN|nr:hypothetical protein F8144_01365 [Streptomyces triticiradicis]
MTFVSPRRRRRRGRGPGLRPSPHPGSEERTGRAGPFRRPWCTRGSALIALARRRVDILFTMLRDGTFYQPPAPTTA